MYKTGEKGRVDVGRLPDWQRKQLYRMFGKRFPSTVAVKTVDKVSALRNVSIVNGATLEQTKAALVQVRAMHMVQHVKGVVKLYGCMVSPRKGGARVQIFMEDLSTYDSASGDLSSIRADVSAAVEAMHAANVIHGDLWSPNVLVKRDRSGPIMDWRIIDFGEACVFWREGDEVIRSAGRMCPDWQKRICPDLGGQELFNCLAARDFGMLRDLL
jgi:hypothetical protein